ncbi:alpha/beta hydrolase family protein [Nocardia sp. CDC160]|uniref:alpha/beta hydrolase family protein n=1 Tax=Nocardia sp. CDC160 TaxID=3112166 RepID=UPI002DBFE04B|nr:alpha/beta fold hydrolase [Nocardia sp. CDC160]MEC3920141.1 alpha/beta fold hydrolase [Nocardia sp. CDC160]
MRSREVSWELGPTTVYGTLVKPDGAGPFPGVAFVAGSGPTDRDWNSPLLPGTNGSGRLLAEALAEAGIASIRYDKRASGPHVRETIPLLIGTLSMRSHLDELIGAVHLLADEDDIRGDRIFGLGNSEGTLHVLNYALSGSQPPFAGLILAAPPGRAVGDVARAQLAAQATALPNGTELMGLYDASIARFQAGEAVAPDPELPEGVRNLLLSLENPANLPFARELWTADAAQPLRRVRVPVLVVIGKKDLQVDWQADGQVLERAADGHENVSFLFPENANHILKYEPRPHAELTQGEAMTQYNSADTHLDPETVSALVTWLRARL